MKGKFLTRLLVSLLVVLLVFVAACSTTPSVQGAITDDLGRRVEIEGVPQRIVSLAPSNTELLFALGLGDRVVGVTKFCNYPEAALSKEKVGGFADIDMEKVVSLRPDLVVAASIHQSEVIPALEKVGLKVIGLDASTLEGMLADMRLLGRITGKDGEAGRLADDLEKRVRKVTDRTQGLPSSQRPRVLFVVWHDPIWTAGTGTLANDLIEKAGGRNIASDLTSFQTISLERVVEQDPEVIITLTGHGEARDMPFKWAKSEARLANTAARRASPPRVYQVDADITARSTPRAVDALEVLAKLVHPELF